MNPYPIIIALVIVLAIIVRNKRRGFFWRDKEGKGLSFKQFIGRWKEGIQGITPLQQTKTTLWSYLPIVAGLVWGLVITLVGETYWLSLILAGSLPITTIQIVSAFQRYISQKKVEEAFKEAMSSTKPRRYKK